MPRKVSFRGHTAHSSYPDLAARKRLIAKVLLARAFKLRVPAGNSRSPGLRNVIDAADGFIAREANRNGVAMSTFLRELIEVVDGQILRELENPQGLDLRGGLTFLKIAATSFRKEAEIDFCTECQERRNQSVKCSGLPIDGTIVADALAAGTGCMDHFAAMFRRLVDIAENKYDGRLDGKSEDLTITFRVAHSPRLVTEASTSFQYDEPTQRHAELKVELPIEFNETHLTRLPYVLFHEIFVHAPESWTELTRRKPTNERCSFREGFMDAAALYALEAALRGQSFPEGHDEFREHYIAGAKAAHAHRTTLGPQGAQWGTDDGVGDLIRFREDGVRPFRRMREAGLGDEALAVALSLNPLSLTELDRARIVAALESLTGALWEAGPDKPGATRWINVHRTVLAALAERRPNDLFTILTAHLDPAEF